jgi:hypothetical protein
MRHLLGALGVLAASVLLAVSAALNWSFGYSLGSTEFDGMILGAASVAADCFKALMPFFFFAAYRLWSLVIRPPPPLARSQKTELTAANSAVLWQINTRICAPT